MCITMYIVRTYECTSRILKKIAQMFQNLSELCTPPPPQGWIGDSDL